MKMSIHRGLAEIKMLDKRIERSINETKYIGSKKKSAKKVNNSTLNKEEFEKEIISNYQSVNDLISRRLEIKRLIVLSNANTKVEIGSKEYTVAEAIETKTIIETKKCLLRSMKNQYKSHNANVNEQNEKVEENLDKQIQVMLGSDKQNKTSGLEGFIEQYKLQNEWEIVDSLNIVKEIKRLEDEIEEFETNVDFVLSESNATTFIEIED